MTTSKSSASPFYYSRFGVERDHGPDGYRDVQSFRPWLRDDFAFRCVYCLLREQWGRVTGQFDLDHFVPLTHAAAGLPTYDNLVYACHACNLRKRDNLLPDILLTAANVCVFEDGSIVGRTADAEKVIRMLYLNSPQTIQWRRMWTRVIQLAGEHDEELFVKLMGFPGDLPDLAVLNVPRNSRPNGIENSYHVRRARGVLPAIYLS